MASFSTRPASPCGANEHNSTKNGHHCKSAIEAPPAQGTPRSLILGRGSVRPLRAGRNACAVRVGAVGVAVAVLVNSVGTVHLRSRWRSTVRGAVALVLTRVAESIPTARDDRIVDTQPGSGVTAIGRARVQVIAIGRRSAYASAAGAGVASCTEVPVIFFSFISSVEYSVYRYFLTTLAPKNPT